MNTVLMIFIITLLGLIFIGVPIFVSIGLTSITIWLFSFGMMEASIVMQKMFSGLNNFTLLAIPLFMLTGELMNSGGLSRRLIEFAEILLGWIKGGLGFSVILASMFIAAILGSASASAAMIGAIMIPAMVNAGYRKDFSAALVAASGSIGPIIPPSITFIVYGVIAGVSISKLFIAGYIPGIAMGISFMVYTYYVAHKYNYPSGTIPNIKSVFYAFKKAFLTLLLPVIIMGGIILGVFTPTEAGAIAVIYSLFLGIVVFREFTYKKIKEAFLNASYSSAMVLMVCSVASLMSWVFTLNQIPQMFTKIIISISDNPFIFLIILNIFLIIVGMFLDATSAIIIIAPLVIPIAQTLGIDLIVLGIIISINLMIGVLTPPVGLNLYVVSGISNIPLLSVSKSVLPFILCIFLVLLLLVFFPQLITFLPSLID